MSRHLGVSWLDNKECHEGKKVCTIPGHRVPVMPTFMKLFIIVLQVKFFPPCFNKVKISSDLTRTYLCLAPFFELPRITAKLRGTGVNRIAFDKRISETNSQISDQALTHSHHAEIYKYSAMGTKIGKRHVVRINYKCTGFVGV